MNKSTILLIIFLGLGLTFADGGAAAVLAIP
jgi:hypothetical protein